MRKKKKHEGREASPATPHEASVHVHVSGDSMDDVHDKISRLAGRGKRKNKRESKRGSHRE